MTYLRFIYVVLVSNYLFKGILNIYYNFFFSFIRVFLFIPLFHCNFVPLFFCSFIPLFLYSFISLFFIYSSPHNTYFFLLGLGRLGCFVVVICSRQKLYVHKGPFIIYGGGGLGKT